MAKLCPVCGPVLSTFCMIISVWGVVFLALLGLFFNLQAVTLFPDLHFEEHEEYRTELVEEKYSLKAQQCWMAAGLYLATFVFVYIQNRWNPPVL
uniref:Ribonuclease kappa n=2 Tax=Panagrolaimus TaxID=55784 RepID=A0A914Q1S7_9BILA